MTVPSMTPGIAPSIDLADLAGLVGAGSAPEGSAPTTSFESTLGAMIAAAFLPAQTAEPATPAEPLLELVLDGEWVPEEQIETDATTATDPTGTATRA